MASDRKEFLNIPCGSSSLQKLAKAGNLGKHCARFSDVMYTCPDHDGRASYLRMNMSEKSFVLLFYSSSRVPEFGQINRSIQSMG